MLKVIVKNVGTDLFLKVIRVDIEVADDSRVETFTRFTDFDETKKPTADELNSLIGETKHIAVQTFRKKQLMELARSIEDCHMGVASCDCEDCNEETASAVQPKPETASAVVEPVAAPTPVVEPVAAPDKPQPVKEEPKKAAPAKKAAAKKEEQPKPEPVKVEPKPEPVKEEPAVIPTAVVPLTIADKNQVGIVSTAIREAYGPDWNKDKTSNAYVQTIAHLKSFAGKPFFLADGVTIAPAIWDSFKTLLNQFFTEAEAVSV